MSIRSFTALLVATALAVPAPCAKADPYRLQAQANHSNRINAPVHRLGGGAAGMDRLAMQNLKTRLVPITTLSLRLQASHHRINTVASSALGQMRLIAKSREANRLRYEDLNSLLSKEQQNVTVAKPITVADLRSGVAIGAGWSVRVPETNTVEIYHQDGRLVRYDGDPHLKSKDGIHYGDWTSDHVLLALPSANPNDRCLVYAESTGGSASNGFGLPTRLVALTDTRVTTVTEINGTNPSGYQTLDALVSFEALRSKLDSAAVYYYSQEFGELRFANGERPAPPSNARDYVVRRPSAADDPESLVKGSIRWLIDTKSTTPVSDQEYRQRVAQIVNATQSPFPEVRAAAETLKQKVNGELKQYIHYLNEREILAEKGARVSDGIADLLEEMRSDTSIDEQRLKSIETRILELEEESRAIEKLLQELKEPS